MLRGLFADIVNDTAKAGLYSFNRYKICLINKCKEEDIEMLDGYMILKKNSKLKDDNTNKRELSNKRHRKDYADRRKRKVCVRCKNPKLEILRNGIEGIMCKECGKRKRVIDKRTYHERCNK